MAQTGQITIPKAEFIDDVPKFMSGKSVDPVIQTFDEQRRKFKMVEQQLVQRKARLMLKQPEIQKTLDIVKTLIENSDEGGMSIDFELAESIYAKSKVAGVKTVNLWLGADVMVEYSLQEAKDLLEANLEICKTNIKNHDEGIEMIRDNVTTLEVSISRVWNYDVERRRQTKEAGASSSS